MTDPHDLLNGPPRYLPPELVDLLRGLVGNIADPAQRRALRKWGEACFDAGFALGIQDPTPEDERTLDGIAGTFRTSGYGYSTITSRSDTPAFDALHGSTDSQRGQLP